MRIKKKIVFFREQIKNSLEVLWRNSLPFGWVEGSEIRLEENPNASEYLHMMEVPPIYGKESASLIEFT